MSRRVDTANRTGLALLGLLLLGGGAVGLAAGYGVFGDPPPVLPGSARRFEDQQSWFWWAAACWSRCWRCAGCSPSCTPVG
jgi:hypothetical protein